VTSAPGGAQLAECVRRFREFVQLDEHLRSAYKDTPLESHLPVLPDRMSKLLLDHHAPEFLAQRRIALQFYLQSTARVAFVAQVRLLLRSSNDACCCFCADGGARAIEP
jgi:hypothetical protein